MEIKCKKWFGKAEMFDLTLEQGAIEIHQNGKMANGTTNKSIEFSVAGDQSPSRSNGEKYSF